MGRQGPRLVPFLEEGLINKKYRNLISEDSSGLIFSIVLPHKTKKLDIEDELIFKDWYALNKKKYVFHSKHYTDAKQAITASLRKSDYVEKMHISDDKLTYRILSKAEIKEKKRLKKELKKLNEVKKEASDSESGYGSGTDSPQNDNAPLLVNDTNNNESSSAFDSKMVNSLLGINDVMLNTFSVKLDGFLKSECMDANISVHNSLAVPDAPGLFEVDTFTNLQPYVDYLKSTEYFPENIEHPTHGLELMDCSFQSPELDNSGLVNSLPFESENGCDFLQLDSLPYEDLSNLLVKDVPAFNSNPLSMCEDNINPLSETQNGHQMPTEPQDLIIEEMWKKLIEDISAIDFQSSVVFDGKGQEQISSTPDAGLPDHKTEADENIYLCKKCVHLGKIPVLFCEPQFKKDSETSGEFKIAFEEAVWNEISGFKCVKEFKFINDHLMLILEPNDE